MEASCPAELVTKTETIVAGVAPMFVALSHMLHAAGFAQLLVAMVSFSWPAAMFEAWAAAFAWPWIPSLTFTYAKYPRPTVKIIAKRMIPARIAEIPLLRLKALCVRRPVVMATRCTPPGMADSPHGLRNR